MPCGSPCPSVARCRRSSGRWCRRARPRRRPPSRPRTAATMTNEIRAKPNRKFVSIQKWAKLPLFRLLDNLDRECKFIVAATFVRHLRQPQCVLPRPRHRRHPRAVLRHEVHRYVRRNVLKGSAVGQCSAVNDIKEKFC